MTFPREQERHLTMINRFAEAFRTWCKYRETSNELMRFCNRDVMDIGIRRVDIPTIVRRSARF
jgi:uncharacterized protein YjiS (DUF1127 family)